MSKVFAYALARNYKIKCPDCGNKTFVPYVEPGTKNVLNEIVGKCDRSANCGRHYTPAQYRTDYPENSPVKPFIQPVPYVAPKPLQYIPKALFESSLKGYDANTFVSWLLTLFDAPTVERLITTYYIGTSCSRWAGAAIFWYISANGKVKAGQVKKFNEAGHTDSYYSNKAGKNKKCTEWVHTVLKYKYVNYGEALPGWLADYIDRGDYCTTLYGEHLINLPENINKPIALCEAPKTAIIASVYLPQYVWLATGALDYFTEQRIRVLAGREVFLFPDLSICDNEPDKPYGKVFYKWQNRGLCYSHIANFHTSDILERAASDEDRVKGLDLCDYLINIPYSNALLEEFKRQMISGVPEDKQPELVRCYIDMGVHPTAIKQVLTELINNYGFEIAA